MAVVIASAIGALGTVISAYIAVVASRTRRAVNGRHDELEARVELLEELLRWTRAEPPD